MSLQSTEKTLQKCCFTIHQFNKMPSLKNQRKNQYFVNGIFSFMEKQRKLESFISYSLRDSIQNCDTLYRVSGVFICQNRVFRSIFICFIMIALQLERYVGKLKRFSQLHNFLQNIRFLKVTSEETFHSSMQQTFHFWFVMKFFGFFRW